MRWVIHGLLNHPVSKDVAVCIPDNLVFPLYFPVLSISGWISGRRGKWCAGTRIGRWSHVGKRWLLHRVAFSFCASSHTKAARSLHSTGVSLLCSEPSFLVPAHHRCHTHDKNDTNDQGVLCDSRRTIHWVGTFSYRTGCSASAESRKDNGPLPSLTPLGESSRSETTQRRAEAEIMGYTSLADRGERWCSISSTGSIVSTERYSIEEEKRQAFSPLF